MGWERGVFFGQGYKKSPEPSNSYQTHISQIMKYGTLAYCAEGDKWLECSLSYKTFHTPMKHANQTCVCNYLMVGFACHWWKDLALKSSALWHVLGLKHMLVRVNVNTSTVTTKAWFHITRSQFTQAFSALLQREYSWNCHELFSKVIFQTNFKELVVITVMLPHLTCILAKKSCAWTHHEDYSQWPTSIYILHLHGMR